MASESKQGDENALMGVASAAMGSAVATSAPAPAPTGPTGPTPELLDFWKTLWHVDVYKDHGKTYNDKIINRFLPDANYTTTQLINGYKISTAGLPANRNGGDGNVLGFAELFEYLTTKKFADIQKKDKDGKYIYYPGFKTNSQLNEKLMGGKIVNYEIQVFDDKGFGNNNKSEIADFIGGHKIALFVDTSSHLPELIQNYDKKENIAYAYTREIENDPASKTTYLTIKPPDQNQNNFFYEKEAPTNPTVIAYPPYSPATAQDGMSYFYCKYPVFLSNNGIREQKKYNLKATLSYIRDDNKTITITDGANTANAFDKFKEGLKKILGIKSDDIIKEIVFISKHHGDVAQSLVKFRDVRMECPKNPGTLINTADYKATFVSIDVNAIIKALTIETPIIFMYPPDKDRIIVWKNNSLNSPEIQFESETKFTNELQAKLLESVKKYNDQALHAQINKAMVDAKAQINLNIEANDIKDSQNLEYYASLYKDILQLAVHISTLLRYIPDKELKMVDSNDFNKQAEIDTIIASADTFEQKNTKLKNIQKELSQKEAELVIPIQYRTLLVTGFNLEAVSFEKEVILEFKKYQKEAKEAVLPQAKVRAGPTYSFKQGDKRVDHMWEVTNLNYNIGDFSIDSLSCRFGTKLNISWAFDVIHYCYNNLGEYKDNFIKTLYNIVAKAPSIDGKPTKLDTFKFGLGLVGIPLPADLAGGSKTLTITQVQTPITLPKNIIFNKTVKNNKVKNKSAEKEPLEIVALRTEYNDMIGHLEFMLVIMYLYKYYNRIPYSAFQLVGLEIYQNFLRKYLGQIMK